MTTSPTEWHTQSGTSAIALRKLGNLLRKKRKGFKLKYLKKKNQDNSNKLAYCNTFFKMYLIIST